MFYSSLNRNLFFLSRDEDFPSFQGPHKLLITFPAPEQWNYCLLTEIQPSKWQLPEEWPPSCRPHQTSTLLSLPNRQPGIRLPILCWPPLPHGPLQPERKAQRNQTRGRLTGSHHFIQWLHHSHPGPQTGGRIRWGAVRKPCEVRSHWKKMLQMWTRCCRRDICLTKASHTHSSRCWAGYVGQHAFIVYKPAAKTDFKAEWKFDCTQSIYIHLHIQKWFVVIIYSYFSYIFPWLTIAKWPKGCKHHKIDRKYVCESHKRVTVWYDVLDWQNINHAPCVRAYFFGRSKRKMTVSTVGVSWTFIWSKNHNLFLFF